MSSKVKSDITSNSQPKNKGKQKDITPKEAPKEASPKSDLHNTQTKTNDTTLLGKRPLSSSPAESSKKRQDNKTQSSSPPNHLSYTDLAENWSPSLPQTDNPQSLQLTYHKGDIFSKLSPNTLLIHACNTQGHWGAGIAKAFKTNYPKAYKAHHEFCAKEHSKASPVPTGTTQLLAPIPGDGDTKTWIGCVFTSARYGKMKDRPEDILRNTGRSMEMLLELVKVAGERDGEGVGVIRMCKINSGKFGVPWERTEKVLKAIVLREGWTGTVEVWEP